MKNEEVLTGKILKQLMRDRGITQNEMARKLGVKGQNNVTDYLRRDMKYSLLIKFLDACDYDIQLVDRVSKKRLDADGDVIYKDVNADPVIPVEMPLTGSWVSGKELRKKHPDADVLNSIFYCSNCMSEAYRDSKYGQQLMDYCPCCGARMN